MGLQSGRVGVNPDQVDEFGILSSKDVTFNDLVNFKLKLDISLLSASTFEAFKDAMTSENND